MSERTALILASAAIMALLNATCLVLFLLDADGTAFGLTAGLFAALGGYVSSGIIMRYSTLKERRKREEILLSR